MFPLHPENRWLWRSLAIGLILFSSVLHIAYLLNDCPLDLAPDEAQYWDWSRHLDWSYYSKGPVVALLIRGSCELMGPWAEATTGSIMPAIRMPAVLCGALLLASMYVLTVLTLKRESLACGVVALALTLPLIAAGSSLMTIDAPYTACWGWALVFAHLAAVRGKAWAWPVTGLIVAVGILAKYTMVLFLPSLGLFLLLSREHRPLLLRRGFWIMTAIAALSSVPILIWNSQHDWVTFRHVGGQAGVGAGLRWLGPLTFVGGQFALLLGFWFVGWAAAMYTWFPPVFFRFPPPLRGRVRVGGNRPNGATQGSVIFLWCLSAPMFAVFLILSLKSTGQLNWAVTAYLSGAVLAAAWLADNWSRRVVRFGMATTAVLGIALTLAVHFPSLSRPVLLSIAGPPTARYPLPLRRVDPTARLRGYRTLSAAVDSLRAEARATGDEPIVAATVWNLPGLLAAYGHDHPTVYTLGTALYDRRSQLDFWRPNPVWDPEQFRGRTFVIVGDFAPALLAAFEHVETPREVVYREAGQPVALWHIGIARGFKGFPPPDKFKY